jgi:hypothetical protein
MWLILCLRSLKRQRDPPLRMSPVQFRAIYRNNAAPRRPGRSFGNKSRRFVKIYAYRARVVAGCARIIARWLSAQMKYWEIIADKLAARPVGRGAVHLKLAWPVACFSQQTHTAITERDSASEPKRNSQRLHSTQAIISCRAD